MLDNQRNKYVAKFAGYAILFLLLVNPQPKAVMFEDAGLDSVMESHINGGAGDVIERQDSREAYPCPICGDALCNGGCDHGPGEPELHPDDLTHRGVPGDGSGEDDLADLMAHGDEGCCDGPEDFGWGGDPELCGE